MLGLRGLGKDYGDRTVVGSIDLDVARGECLGLLGPNGAGKTTTISMICGVLEPTRGSVTIDGADVHADPFTAKARLGLVPQELALYEDLTAIQNLRYFGALYGLGGPLLVERIRWALDAVGLGTRGRDVVSTYSGGMKRRLNLATALVHRPDLVVMDEPTVGVDAQSRYNIFALVRSLKTAGTTIIYTSHYLEEIEALCDRVAIIDQGRLVACGNIRELIAAHAGKRVVIELGGGEEVLDVAVREIATHALVQREGSTVRLMPHAGLTPIVAAIERAGATIVRIEARGANLEAAFLGLTGHALRDAS